MFPTSLYPTGLFPDSLFPKIGSRGGSSIYGDLLVGVVDRILANTTPFNANTAMVTMWPEPFPTAGGPLTYVMPGAWRQLATHIDGAGRYYSLYDCQFTVRIIDRSLRDPAFVDTARLTRDTTGLLRTVHDVINVLDIEFVFEEDGVTPICVEPLKLLSATKPKTYGSYKNTKTFRGGHIPGDTNEWCYVDLNFNAKLALNFINFELPDLSATDSTPAATNLADLLLSIQSLIVGTEAFTLNECPISLSSEPFPQIGTPFCLVTPGEFRTVDGHWSGDGRHYATLDGTVTLSIIERNVMDQSYLDYQRLLNPRSIYGMYACHQSLVEGTHLQFPVNPDGLSLTEEGIRLVSVDKPRYYGDAKSWCALDSVYAVRYFPEMTLPDATP